MGYSCNAISDMVFEQITKILQEDGPETKFGNEYYYAGKWHFWSIGREREDGAVVGSVFEHVGKDLCRRVGSFHVDGNGRIIRFPGSTKKQRIKAEREGIKKYLEEYVRFSDSKEEQAKGVEKGLQEHIKLFLTKE